MYRRKTEIRAEERGPRRALLGLLYIEILAGEQHFDRIVEYFARYSICRWALHESGHKVWLRARSTKNINIVVARAVSERERRRVQHSGTTVVDIGLLVEDLEAVLARARAASESGVFLRHPRRSTKQAVWATICSPVSSIVHTVVDRSSYDGTMLPGWRQLHPVSGKACWGEGDGTGTEIAEFSAVDHITIACARGTTYAVSMWYQSVLGLKDLTGATTLQSSRGGLRLSALWSRRWQEEAYASSVTLTFVESLGHSGTAGQDQVAGFLAEHAMSGVQHVALFAPDILATESRLRQRGVEFISAPPAYYEHAPKVQQIESVGLAVEELKAGQILFDGDVGGSCEHRGYLLQVFTPPPFERNTLFFELIFRSLDVKGEQVQGFGAGNIRDLFRAVAEARTPKVRPGQVMSPSTSKHTGAAGPKPDPKTQELYRRMQAECAEIFAENSGMGQGLPAESRSAVILIGAGLCGLAAALALVECGVDVTLIESCAALPLGTRAVTWVRSSLEFLDSLGVGAELSRGSVPWARGVIRRGPSCALEWRAPVNKGEYPAYSNIPQYVVHASLLKRLARSKLCRMMFNTTVTGLAGGLQPGGMVVYIEGPDGDLSSLVGTYVIDSSGAHSEWRSHMVADQMPSCEGAFLIADMHAEGSQQLPDERVFWFNAPFHNDGQTFLMLPQPGGVLRMDFGLDSCPVDEASVLLTAPERARRALVCMQNDPRYAALDLNPDGFRLGWSSLYKYASGSLERAVEGRLLWVGDSLKRVSPFGARGGNEGLRDVAALVWRLAWILRGGADASLLEDYSQERTYSAACDVLINRATMRFIDPPASMRFLREAVLGAYEESRENQSIGQFINTGRFPTPPPSLRGLSTFSNPLAENGDWSEDCLRPGDYFDDGLLAGGGSLFSLLSAQTFILLVFGPDVALDLRHMPWVQRVCVHLEGREDPRASVDLVRAYDARPGTCLLLRPDLFVLARWRRFDASCLEFCSQIANPQRGSEALPKATIHALSAHDAVYWLLYQALDGLDSEAAKLSLVGGLLQEYAVHVPMCASLLSATEELIKALAQCLEGPAPEEFDLQRLRVILARLSIE